MVFILPGVKCLSLHAPALYSIGHSARRRDSAKAEEKVVNMMLKLDLFSWGRITHIFFGGGKNFFVKPQLIDDINYCAWASQRATPEESHSCLGLLSHMSRKKWSKMVPFFCPSEFQIFQIACFYPSKALPFTHATKTVVKSSVPIWSVCGISCTKP